jgi:hypothetical protein
MSIQLVAHCATVLDFSRPRFMDDKLGIGHIASEYRWANCANPDDRAIILPDHRAGADHCIDNRLSRGLSFRSEDGADSLVGDRECGVRPWRAIGMRVGCRESQEDIS